MTRKTLLTVMMLTLIGCSAPPDTRMEQLTQQSLHTQAEQNRQMTGQSRQVVEASKRLVEADSQARQEVIQLQREIVERDAQGRAELDQLVRETHTEISADKRQLDRQRHELEQERRQIAEQRHRDPVIAASLGTLGLVLACLLPLLLCAYVLYTVNRASDDDALVGELLVQELTAEQPLLLPSPSRSLVLPHEQPESTGDAQVDDS